ncbi:hypothetical protein ACGFZ3_00755 [Stenotrophomonas sp. NPDC047960]|uniref:hypothetical protein n=1 Tax=Stenotrophomonas sp. NPDC047960 TaxID=3364531 RepID=UPI003718A096
MPLYDNAPPLILDQLRRIAGGERVGIVEIGELTVSQFDELVRQKRELGHEPPASRMLVYLGRHRYESRVRKDGYLPCDLVCKLQAALACSSVIETHRHMTAVVSTNDRNDGHGNKVRDRAILELQARKPRAEVFSVVPKGDLIRPKKQQSP